MSPCDRQEASGRWIVFRGILVFAGIVVVAVVVLLLAAVAAAVGLGVSLVVMPWLMPLLWVLSRRRRRRSQFPGARFKGAASRVDGRGGTGPLMRPGQGPISVH